MTVRVVLVLALLLAFASTASAGPGERYAGITRAAAIAKAEEAVLSLAKGAGRSPAQIATARRYMASHPPRVTRSSCSPRAGRRVLAWRVSWNGGDPLYVNRSGVVCLVRVTS